MEYEWESTTLGTLGTFRNGVNFNRGQEGSGIPVLKVKDFGDRVFVPEFGLDELNESVVEISSDNHLMPGDTVIMRSNGNSALVGRSLYFVGASRPVTFSGFCIRFRPNQSRAFPRFAAYLIRSPFFRQRFTAHGSGTGITNLSQDLLASVPVNLPWLTEQEGIAGVLAALDDRIELHQRASVSLEAIARAIFKSWFVDFDPVRAKAKGREPEGMDGATAALFPNQLCDSEFGSIPANWKWMRAGEVMQLSRKTLNPLRHPDVLFAHYSLPAFDGGKQPVLELGREIKSNKTIIPSGSILLSKLNPHIPRVWLPPYSLQENAVCSTEFLVFQPKQGLSVEYLFCQFTEEGFVQRFGGLTTGTSNSHQRVKVAYLLEQWLVAPDKRVLEAFTGFAHPLFEKISANIGCQKTLSELRDTLLPRLISGKLRVPEAEKLAEAVL